VPPKLRGVNLVGYTEAIQNLQRFDKETLKVLNAEIYQTVKATVKEARNLVPAASPLSGWGKPILVGKWKDHTYKNARVKMGIKNKIGRQRIRGFWTSKTIFLQSAEPAGAIYETAGRKNPNGITAKGADFIRAIEAQSGIVVRGKQGRIVTKTAEDRAPRMENDLRTALNKATAKVNLRLAK
jgi:hypothetical protein